VLLVISAFIAKQCITAAKTVSSLTSLAVVVTREAADPLRNHSQVLV